MALSDEASIPGDSPSGDQGQSRPDREVARASVEAEPAALPAGATVGRYEIVALLRHEALGPTYRGRDSVLGRDVLVREFLPATLAVRSDDMAMMPRAPELAAELEGARERFVEEARSLSTLQRAPFLTRVVDLVEANGTFYVVLDLVAGISLDDRLHGGKSLRPDEVDRLMRALLEALQQLHDTNLLHGDITPANVMLDMSGRPTLVNVAGTRAAMAVATRPSGAQSRSAYAAPERPGSDASGPWTDIYSLAATFHCAIVGRPPPDAVERLRWDSYRRLTTFALPDFPPALLAGIDRGLELAPGDRPQSVAAWQAMLWPAGVRALAATAPSQVEALYREARRLAPGRGARFWITALAAVVVGVAVAGGVHLLGGTKLLVEAFSSPPKPHRPAGLDQSAKLALERAEAQARQATVDEIRRKRQADKIALASVEDEMRQQEELRKKEQADAAAAALRRRRQEEQAILKKLEAEAEAERQADAAAAAKQKAEADIEAKRQAEAEARRQVATLDLRAAEAAEAALRLSRLERQHVQVALNALGFDVGSFDGSMGGRTRQAIADWQRVRRQPPTGFLTAAQIETILKDAPPQAIAQFDALQDPQRAEADEAALALSPLDRRHVQVALASLGFDAGEIDGIFGPRTRQMIAVWQASHGEAPTGFVTATQVETLVKNASRAIGAYDDTLEPTRAEAREAALNLSLADRRRLQAALTAQGFDTWGTDGRFGPRTRQMIAAWQKAQKQPASGFLTDSEVPMLLGSAATARSDDNQETVVTPPRGAPMIDATP
jgi:peptidoglycan hydrolase-like protein with peptidoglycan-binding domain